MRFFWLTILSLGLLYPQNAEADGFVKGRILEGESGNGLPGATVTFRRGGGSVAGNDGGYLLKLPQGNQLLSFQFVGYTPVTHSVSVATGDTVYLDVKLFPYLSEIDQVVVSASRIEQRLSELTVSLSLIKPQFLESSHINDAQELINKSPGIEVLDGQASVRGGSGFSYGAGSRVLALIDGLPVMAPDAGNIRWQFLPLDNLSQIEIIKGASSVAYGSSALNGIINFRTENATPQPVTRIFMETGWFDAPVNRDWKWWTSPRIFSSGSVSHLQRMGKTDLGLGMFLLNENSYRSLNDEKLGRLSLKLKRRHTSNEGLTYGINLNGGLTEKTDFLLWENATTGALRHSATTARELNSLFVAVDPYITLMREDHHRHEFKGRIQHSNNRFPEAAENESKATNFYSEYQYWRKVSEIVSLNAGLSENFSLIVSNFYGNHTAFNAGAFAQVDLSLANRLKLVSGLRIEHNFLNGIADKPVPLFRTGVNYRLHDFTFMRASFGMGYRYPSIAEKYAATTLGSVRIFPSPYIEAESGWNAEIGFKQGIGTPRVKGQADIALFYSENRNLIEYEFGLHIDPLDGSSGFGFKASNLEASRVYGLELEYVLNGKTGSVEHQVTGGYVYMYPVEFNPITGKNSQVLLKYRRHHAGSFNLSSNFGRFETGLSLNVKSRMLNIDRVFLAPETRESLLPGFFDYWQRNNTGYLIADVQVGAKLTHRYKLSMVVKNLTNVEYMGRPGDIQPVRNFSLRLSGRF